MRLKRGKLRQSGRIVRPNFLLQTMELERNRISGAKRCKGMLRLRSLVCSGFPDATKRCAGESWGRACSARLLVSQDRRTDKAHPPEWLPAPLRTPAANSSPGNADRNRQRLTRGDEHVIAFQCGNQRNKVFGASTATRAPRARTWNIPAKLKDVAVALLGMHQQRFPASGSPPVHCGWEKFLTEF